MVMISDTYSESTNNKMDMPEDPLLFVGLFLILQMHSEKSQSQIKSRWAQSQAAHTCSLGATRADSKSGWKMRVSKSYQVY